MATTAFGAISSPTLMYTASQADLQFLALSGGTMTGNLVLNADATTALQAVTYQQLLSTVVGVFKYQQGYDASGNTFPTATNTNPVVANVSKGFIWNITVSGTLGGTAVVAGDTVLALVDTPGQTASNWLLQEFDFGYTPLSNVLNSAQIFVGNASNVATGVTLSGDAAISNAGALTLANTAVTASSYGSATQSPIYTVDSKGRLTAAANVLITPAASSITGAADLTKADDTNVTITLGGTPVGSLLKSTSLTLGWSGTLAAARLNSNVVQAITNDTNVTGSITSQNLTLGWSGQLSSTRGGSGINNTGTFTWGANAITFTTGGLTGVTLPTSGTLSTLAGSETFTNKVSYNGLVITSNTGVVTTGTWNGSIVIGTYGGTGVNNSTRTITIAGNLITTGAFNTTLATGFTGTITLPTATSTLATLALTEIFTNKTLSGNTSSNFINSTGTLNINSSGTITVPNATDTLTGKATTDVFTNKTYDTAGTGNVFKINGTTISAVTGTGSVVLATSPTLVTPNIDSATGTTLTLNTPTTADSLARLLVSTGATTNKAIVAQGIASQTANLYEAQDSTGTVMFKVASSGVLTVTTANNAGTFNNNTDADSALDSLVLQGSGRSVTAAANYARYLRFEMSATVGVTAATGRIGTLWENTPNTAGNQNSSMVFHTINGGTLSEKWRITATGNLSNTGVAGTAYIALKAGTASANTAPLRFTSGTNLTTPVSGAVEYDGTLLTFSPSTTRLNFVFNNYGTSGGTTLVGDTAASGNLTLSSTSNATKGFILFGTSAYDEVNNRLGLGTATPAAVLAVGAITVSTNCFNIPSSVNLSTSGAAINAFNFAPTITINTNLNCVTIRSVPTYDLNFSGSASGNTVGTLNAINQNANIGGTNSNSITNYIGQLTRVTKTGSYTGVIANCQMLQISAPISFASGQITTATGISVAEQTVTGITNYTNLLLGTITAPTGIFSIYNSSTSNNAHAGSTTFGATTAPTQVVDITGNAQATGSILSSSATLGIGYKTGAGGAVTQSTSKSTGVTLNTISGAITMNNAALAGTTAVSFTLTNSAIAATDVIIVNLKSGNTAASYTLTVDAVAAGSCNIALRNFTGGSLSEAVIISFAIIKAVTA